MAKYNVVVETDQSRDVLNEVLQSVFAAQGNGYSVVSVQEKGK